MVSTVDLEHLLRRTEYVVRPARLAELSGLTLDAAVDDLLGGPAPARIPITETIQWRAGEQFNLAWIGQMSTSVRPLREKMAFFWHNHFVSGISKATGFQMAEQIELYRAQAYGNVRQIAKDMSTTLAMIMYLDDHRNRKTSPNQNFARELMELFILGVGNYTEDDVVAATAAWTGHGVEWTDRSYRWFPEFHDDSAKRYLGVTINQGGDPRLHGAETIDVMMGNGTVPNTARVAQNRGRPTRSVCAEFLSYKLWRDFAGIEPDPAVIGQLRDVLLASDFEVRPWLKALLTHPAFYTDEVRLGKLRSPIEFAISQMYLLNLGTDHSVLWYLDRMGQLPLDPPNVAGWKWNDYWINASAFGARAEYSGSLLWKRFEPFWNGGTLDLRAASFTHQQVWDMHDRSPASVVDAFAAGLELSLTAHTRDVLVKFSTSLDPWEAGYVIVPMLLCPELQLA